MREIKSISKRTGMDIREISKGVTEVVKGTEAAKISTQEPNAELMYILGLIASDGCVSVNRKGGRPSYRIRFDNNEEALNKAFIRILEGWAPGARITTEKVRNLNRTYAHHFPFAYLAHSMGLKALDRKEDDLRPIFRLPERLIASFIAGFFDGDGSISIMNRKGSKEKRASVEFAIKEYKTAKMLQLFLKRLGIISKMLASINRSGFGTRTMHSVRITTDKDIIGFLGKIPFKHPKKKKRVKILWDILKNKKRANIGKINHAPLVCGQKIKETRERYGINMHSIFDPTFLSMIENGKRVEKSTIERICKAIEKKGVDSKEVQELRKLISDDYYLDPIKKITKIRFKDEFVYNFNVAETHNFVPEGAFVVSNCNGCTLECFAAFNPRYDVTRFGMELKASAKHADVLLVTGIVNKLNISRLKRIYGQLPEPKRVVAIGACCVSGGLYKGSYSQAGPLDKVIPVDVYVPGCPPRPESIIDAIRKCLDDKGKG